MRERKNQSLPHTVFRCTLPVSLIDRYKDITSHWTRTTAYTSAMLYYMRLPSYLQNVWHTERIDEYMNEPRRAFSVTMPTVIADWYKAKPARDRWQYVTAAIVAITEAQDSDVTYTHSTMGNADGRVRTPQIWHGQMQLRELESDIGYREAMRKIFGDAFKCEPYYTAPQENDGEQAYQHRPKRRPQADAHSAIRKRDQKFIESDIVGDDDNDVDDDDGEFQDYAAYIDPLREVFELFKRCGPEFSRILARNLTTRINKRFKGGSDEQS